ncbi:YjgP/YjgQ family permease [Riemerella anatipestifer]|uniref:LptF/LptG family permease n=1 Tax=Riemerella anatipestifer TaxID=34085 RepID=UPI00129DC85C|nr:LptF/LptG family permease [Riemerella anatipestifer]MRN15881.1 YjgP/YjgQ family permease [Riemerella anatipestifer]
MLKKLDRYIIKTFFGPFLFIFSVLFFIFLVNIIWIKLSQFTGKGLSPFEIGKLLFYMGVSVVNMVLPLTVLLSSIMTFGAFGERYELAAMKAAGISLFRIMRPLIFVVTLLSIILFIFSNNVIPDFNRKAKNMLYNIAVTKPALNFTAGQFIGAIPGASVKFDKISGENGENLEGIIIHKEVNGNNPQQTIIAPKGKFVPAQNRNYLKLILYKGYVYEDENTSYNYNERTKQPNKSIKFDSLVAHFDVSELVNKAIEEEKITENYQFQTYLDINGSIAQLEKEQKTRFDNISNELVAQNNFYVNYLDKSKNKKATQPFKIDTLKKEKKIEILYNAYKKTNTLKEDKKSNKDPELYEMLKQRSKMIMYQQRILSFSITCIIFFLIGSSLGSIIRKGGIGFPVVIAIVIFIIFYVLNLTVENLSWKGKLDPYLAAWLPNLILAPLGIWFTVKALTDSQILDAEKYKAFFKPIIQKFSKNKEHKRYQ